MGLGLTILLLATSGSHSPLTGQEPPPPQVGRFYLMQGAFDVIAKGGSRVPEQAVFRIDTVTGETAYVQVLQSDSGPYVRG
jgi:hypothetical protein